MDKQSSEKSKKKKTQEQIWTERLSSPNQEVVRETIKEIRDFGNIKILPAVIERFASEKNEGVKNELAKLLMDIKRKEAVGIIFSYVQNDQYCHIRKDLLSILWQSRMNLSSYINELVDLFISEPFDVAFEAFTVIEYIEQPVDKQIAQENIDKLKLHIQTIDESKKFLLVDLVNLLKRWI